MRPVRPSSRRHPQSVYHPANQSHCLSIPPTVRPSSPPVRPPSRHSIHDSSVRPPTRQSCATSVRLSVIVRPSVHHLTTSVRLSYVTPSARPTNPSVRPSATIPPSVRHTNPSVRPSATIPTSVRQPHPSVRPSATVTPSVRHTTQYVSLSVTSRLSDCHYDSSACTSVIPHNSPYPRLEPHPSSREWEQDSNHSLAVVNGEQDSNHSLAVVNGEQSHTIHRTQDSSQSLAVVNGEQSRKAKIFHRAFTNYDLLLRALDASSIYLRDFRRVAPPQSGEDAHVTRGKCDFGGATLNNPSLGCSYVLPRLWDPGGVSSSANTPRDLSRTIAPSRYPNTLLTGYLVTLPSL